MSEEKNIKEEAVTENETKPVNSVTEEEFLKRVEQAAARGAKRGSGRAGVMSFIRTILPYALIAVLILGVVMPKINSIHDGLNGFTHFEDPAESHDLGAEDFRKIFKVCLADNGSEFSNPKAIESDREGVPRTRVFYCDPASPHQKGSAERNHELIRLCIPKGIDFGRYSPEDIALMMDHINSYARPSLGDKCPYDTFAWFYGRKILDVLGCHKIPPQEIKLNRTLFSKEDDAG